MKFDKNFFFNLSIFLHFLWAIVFLYVWLCGPFTPPPSLRAVFLSSMGVGQGQSFANNVRSMSGAGSLDLVALSLTVLGTVLAVLGLFGFLSLKSEVTFEARKTAKAAALEAAREELPKKLPELINAKTLHTIISPKLLGDTLKSDEDLKDQLALLISRRLRDVKDEGVTPEAADQIAGAFDPEDLESENFPSGGGDEKA